uniref:KRAB domain-containing protein n=1 Tax=Molossus molossus TaxID=27622 RepID=A0A7J8CCS6_MOLMO|nr:hypothetical protein HJG59_020117 [Molossus molossus]
MLQAQESLTFHDVTVDFTWEEWQLLNPDQKNLYKDVMLENFSHLKLVGYQASKPDALSKLERGEEPWTAQDELHGLVCAERKGETKKHRCDRSIHQLPPEGTPPGLHPRSSLQPQCVCDQESNRFLRPWDETKFLSHPG